MHGGHWLVVNDRRSARQARPRFADKRSLSSLSHYFSSPPWVEKKLIRTTPPRRKDVGRKSDKHDCIVALIVVHRRYDDKIRFPWKRRCERHVRYASTEPTRSIRDTVGAEIPGGISIPIRGKKIFSGGGGTNIAPEFKLDELIDVAERVGAPERPTSWPTCASSIVDFNSTVVASNANYLTSTFQQNRNPSMISRTRSSNFLPFSAPQRYSIIDHRGMNSSKIARKIVIEINGICKFVSTIHESSNNSLSSTNNNVNNYKFVSNKWIEQNRWKSNAFAHYQLFMIVITFRKNKLSYNFDQWIFKWLASIGALIRAA